MGKYNYLFQVKVEYPLDGCIEVMGDSWPSCVNHEQLIPIQKELH